MEYSFEQWQKVVDAARTELEGYSGFDGEELETAFQRLTPEEKLLVIASMEQGKLMQTAKKISKETSQRRCRCAVRFAAHWLP